MIFQIVFLEFFFLSLSLLLPLFLLLLLKYVKLFLLGTVNRSGRGRWPYGRRCGAPGARLPRAPVKTRHEPRTSPPPPPPLAAAVLRCHLFPLPSPLPPSLFFYFFFFSLFLLLLMLRILRNRKSQVHVG